MKPELEKKLQEKYPTLFQNCSKPPSDSLMCFGCECGNGWYDLIDRTCEKLSKLNAVLEQVKEKFAGLRIYISNSTDEAFEVCEEAEKESFKICEICGKEGKICSSGFWYTTLCPDHQKELKYTSCRK